MSVAPPQDGTPMHLPDALDALRSECLLVSEVLAEASEQDFSRPTRCTEWNVKELLGHMYRDVDRTNTGLALPPPPAADTNAVTYWRSYDPGPDAADIASRAKELAGGFDSGSELLEAWDEMWRRACDGAATEHRERVIMTWARALTLDDFLKTRVLEITVHGLDLADALRRPPWPTEAGLAITREILRGLLEAELPADLEWDEVTFVETGTGRRRLTEDERAILGPLAERFPLLS